jgi:hypothetical protein
MGHTYTTHYPIITVGNLEISRSLPQITRGSPSIFEVSGLEA